MDDINKKLAELLKLFKNRPHHLSKYLIDNNILSESFKKKLSSLKVDKINMKTIKSISELNDKFNSILEINDIEKSELELTIEMNSKLRSYIDNEEYEKAALIREQMINLKIKIIN